MAKLCSDIMLVEKGETLEDFLENKVFTNAKENIAKPPKKKLMVSIASWHVILLQFRLKKQRLNLLKEQHTK